MDVILKMKYRINGEKIIRIFGELFVKNNKNKCRMKIKEKVMG